MPAYRRHARHDYKQSRACQRRKRHRAEDIILARAGDMSMGGGAVIWRQNTAGRCHYFVIMMLQSPL